MHMLDGIKEGVGVVWRIARVRYRIIPKYMESEEIGVEKTVPKLRGYCCFQERSDK